MTAMNVFARAGGAWLVADTGRYDADGTILSFASKIVASERLSLAITQRGRLEEYATLDIWDWLEAQEDQTGALASLPGLVRQLAEHDREAMASGAAAKSGNLPNGLGLAVALWDHESGSAKALLVATTPELAGGVPPFTLRPVKTVFSPPLPSDPWPGHSFEPDRHLHILAGLQRATVHDDGSYRVGGEMEAVRVGPQGIQHFTVRKWRDRVGERISPRKSLLARLAGRLAADQRTSK